MAERTQILQKYGAQLLVGTSMLIGTALLFYSDYHSEKNKFYRQAQKDKKEAKEKSETLVIQFFTDLLVKNPNITLEQCILRFENAEDGISLQQFAEKKQRTYQMYIESYQGYYNTAKQNIHN